MANVFGPLLYFFTKFGRALPESLRDEERRSTTISPARPPECSDATALARSAVPSSDEEISRQIIRGSAIIFSKRATVISNVASKRWSPIIGSPSIYEIGTAVNWLELLRELVPKASVFAITELIAKSIVNCFCYRA
jgi:hypothetical protein